MLRLASTTPRSRIISSLSVGMAYAENAFTGPLPTLLTLRANLKDPQETC
jgi:hypothetical protein